MGALFKAPLHGPTVYPTCWGDDSSARFICLGRFRAGWNLLWGKNKLCICLDL